MKILQIALLLIQISTSVAADEVLLYDAPPPADAAFVRFLGRSEEKATWKGLTFESGDKSLSDYFVVHAPKVDAQAGAFLIVLPDESVIEEPKKDVAKVTLGLVNLSGKPVSLRTADGKVEIIAQVEFDHAGWRAVNPVAVKAQIFVNDKPVGDPIEFKLRRNEHHTLVLGKDGSVQDIVSGVVSGVVE